MPAVLTGALRQSGSLFALALDVVRAVPRRPFQVKELISQAWFVASVTILPTALVSIPFGAVIALQLGTLTRQLGAQSYTGAASVLAVVLMAAGVEIQVRAVEEPYLDGAHGPSYRQWAARTGRFVPALGRV